MIDDVWFYQVANQAVSVLGFVTANWVSLMGIKYVIRNFWFKRDIDSIFNSKFDTI